MVSYVAGRQRGPSQTQIKGNKKELGCLPLLEARAVSKFSTEKEELVGDVMAAWGR
jgi:hypothetical protein